MARLAAIRSSTEVDDMPPAPELRRTDSGSDYGFDGYPDCEFWERSGYEPLFIATSAAYNGGPPHPRAYVADLMTQADKSLMDAATLRAWNRQWDDLVEAEANAALEGEIEGWGGTGRATFMEPQPSGSKAVCYSFPLSPPRAAARPAICPDAPSRLRMRRGAVSPIPFPDHGTEDKEVEVQFWDEVLTVHIPLWQIAAALIVLSAYMLLVVSQLENCRR
jgi:hypothetical protein